MPNSLSFQRLGSGLSKIQTAQLQKDDLTEIEVQILQETDLWLFLQFLLLLTNRLKYREPEKLPHKSLPQDA